MDRLGQRQLGREVLLRKNAIVCFIRAAGRFGVPWAFLIMERVLRSKRIFGIKTHFFLRLDGCSRPRVNK
jgi:hypothetical protein